jgi:hypothetical protein
MKTMMASATILITGLLASSSADADCTSNPFKMGWDAASEACTDIANGWVPGPPMGERYAEPAESPERTCSAQDVIRCKNAMAQYLRSHHGSGCANLIKRNVSLSGPSGGTGNRARDTWRNYVTTTCNM